MTLTVCLEGCNGMVLASDSRGTFGDPRVLTAQNDTIRKLYSVSKYVGVLLSGANEMGAMIMDEAQRLMAKDSVEGATNVMSAMREVLRRRYGEWFPNFQMQAVQGVPLPMRPALIVTVAGYDADDKGKFTVQRTYSLSSPLDFAPALHNFGFALSGVPQYATYLLNRLYDRALNIDHLKRLAVYVISETATQDGKVGGPIQVATVTQNVGIVLLSAKEIADLSKGNDKINMQLRELFKQEPR
jgi:20S proteasome alpha/beta subunit